MFVTRQFLSVWNPLCPCILVKQNSKRSIFVVKFTKSPFVFILFIITLFRIFNGFLLVLELG